ncbi:hypothetical protein, partial [Alistipes ihumii]|uniref:hypothetical protein n=1 Tax=Alistipes ihumii TaxID=1470347 RepID=UPI00265822BA
KRVNLNRPYWVCLTVFSTLKILPVNEKGQDLKLTQGTYARHIEHSMKKHSQIPLQVLDFLVTPTGFKPVTS